MASTSQEQTGLRRGLSIWQAVGISVALMAPSMAANVIPYPDAAPAMWFPVVAFGWVLLVAIVMVASPGLARKLSLSLERADVTA